MGSRVTAQPSLWQINRILFPILWLAFALRTLWLDKQSLWYDEGVTWYLTQFSLLDLIRWTAADIQPPFYYLVLWVTTRLFGQSEWALRFPSTIFGLLAVPMMWQVGRRVIGQQISGDKQTWWSIRHVALLAAGFMAFSPLMVYYSQEARMYSLLVLQALLGSYLVFVLPQRQFKRSNFLRSLLWVAQGNVRLSLGYILCMASALYTHYFSLFLLIVHTLYLPLHYIRPLKRSPPPSTSPLPLLIFITLLCFTPWLPILLTRLGDDPSYWPGALKLPEILLDVLISFAVGGKREMILEAQGTPLAIGFGLILIGRVVILAVRDQTPQPLIFLLLWLLLPIMAIILLSYRTPKFNPRYTMLAWPAFALLIAQGLHQLYSWRQKGPTRWLALSGYIASLLFILTAWAYALHNWFPGPQTFNQFSKDDFRSTAQFIRERSQPDDTVLLSSGHFAPVWQYYFGSENWTPIPVMETLDISQVTTFDIIPHLQQALQGKGGVWLVTWQDEVIDPNGVVPLLLDVVGERVWDEQHGANFWGLGLKYWRLPDQVVWSQPYPATQPTAVNFGDLVTLRGFIQSDEILPDDAGQAEPRTDEIIYLLWEARQPLQEDYTISLRLRDKAGVVWSQETVVRRPAAYLYPTNRWQVGQILAAGQILPWLPGTPTGSYQLEVGWLLPDGQGVDVLDAQGNPERRTVLLGPIEVRQPIGGLRFEMSTPLRLGPLNLFSASFEPVETANFAVEAGAKVILDTLWQVRDSDSSLEQLNLIWTDEQGQQFSDSMPLKSPYPAGTTFRSRHKLATPAQASPGMVALSLSLPVSSSPVVSVTTLTLQPTERIFIPPQRLDIAWSIERANFNQQAYLLGADISHTQVEPSQTLQLTLYWQALNRFEQDYTVFVHVLGPDGLPLINADHAPPRPTSNWLEGEVITDSLTFTIPPDLAPDFYPIEVGLYNAADPQFARLPLHNSNKTYLILTEIEVMGR